MQNDGRRSLQATTDTPRPRAEGIAGAYIFFGALYFFFWLSGATNRANRLPESFWIVKLRFISSCLILTIWTFFAIREIEDIDIFARVNQEGFDGVQFANSLLDKGLAVAPGEGFGNYKNFIRLSACQDEEILTDGMNILTEYVRDNQ